MDIASERDELKRKLDDWHNWTLMLAFIVVPFLGVHIFQSRPGPTYCDHVIAVSKLAKDSHEEANEDELKAFQAKAFEALEPLVQDCMEMGLDMMDENGQYYDR
jgi:hypothetical protein